jgi:hypothetical protein
MEERGAKILPGNHDEVFALKLDAKTKGISTDTRGLAGRRASEAIEIQIESLLTKDPKHFLSDSYMTELHGKQSEYSPKFFEELAKGLEMQGKKDIGFLDYLLPGFFAARKLRRGAQSFTKNEAVGIWLREQPKMANLNRDAARKILDREDAIEAYQFLKTFREYDNHMIFDGIHCFHSVSWDSKHFNDYLIDPQQAEMLAENGISIADWPKVGIGKAMELAHRLGRKKLCVATGHVHLPSVYTPEDSEMEVTVANPGTVGMPRLKGFRGTDYYDKATYIVKNGSDFEVRLVQYDWQKVHNEMKEMGLPMNPLWAELKGDKKNA